MSEEVDYDGFLAKRIGNTQTKKKTFKYYYFNLIGGSLHYYKDIDVKNLPFWDFFFLI